ncbi:MAG TPA: ATP-binding cassette domain-containing protein [Pseudolysinimonas sp.]
MATTAHGIAAGQDKRDEVETAQDIALSFESIVKTYPGVRAIDDVSLVVRRGEVHALVGENGAGKSTLMGIAAGVVLADSGSVEIGGQPLDPPTAAHAAELGLAIVYQHASTIADLTVRENLVLAAPPSRRRSYRGSASWVAGILAAGGLEGLDPDTRVSSLRTAERQLLEIAKALAFDARVILFDEPTESLTQDESERLFARIRDLTAQGTAVVYISHRLADVRQICDRFTVLRDGKSRGTFDAGQLSENEIVELMIGRAFASSFPPKLQGPAGAVAFDVSGLSGERFTDVSLQVTAGEIVGLAGVEGNGQREFLRALGGLEKQTGSITVAGRRLSIHGVRSAQHRGVYYLPGDRHAEGLLLPLTVAENASLLRLPQIATGGVLSGRKESSLAASVISQFDVRTPSPRVEVSKLSGGNQQKVLIGRIVEPKPTVLLADEPTRGVDVGARAEIYQQLRSYVAGGASVIVLSSDAAELAGLCDRVAVFSRGRVARVIEGDDLSERTITATAVTAVTERSDHTQALVKGRTAAARFLGGDYLPSVIMVALVVAVAVFTGVQNDRFLSPLSIFNLLILTSVTALAGYGQSGVLLTGGIDLAIGPMISLGVVMASYYGGASVPAGLLALGVVGTIAAGVVVGLVNGVLIRRVGLPPVLTTLVTGIVIQGVALLLRSTPGGTIDGPISQLKIVGTGSLPYVFVFVLVIGVLLELALRQTRWGLEFRAAGSSESKALSLGVRVERSIFSGYVLSSVLAVLAGLILSSVVGVGDATTGLSFTLVTVTVAVLGGTSVFGGRGSFIGVVFAALLLQELGSATTFLRLGTAWQQWLPAILIIVGAAVFSRIRRSQAVEG